MLERWTALQPAKNDSTPFDVTNILRLFQQLDEMRLKETSDVDDGDADELVDEQASHDSVPFTYRLFHWRDSFSVASEIASAPVEQVVSSPILSDLSPNDHIRRARLQSGLGAPSHELLQNGGTAPCGLRSSENQEAPLSRPHDQTPHQLLVQEKQFQVRTSSIVSSDSARVLVCSAVPRRSSCGHRYNDKSVETSIRPTKAHKGGVLLSIDHSKTSAHVPFSANANPAVRQWHNAPSAATQAIALALIGPRSAVKAVIEKGAKASPLQARIRTSFSGSEPEAIRDQRVVRRERRWTCAEVSGVRRSSQL